MKRLGLYIHIPFCLQKCNYCDFLSFQGFGSEAHQVYFDNLGKEIQYWGEKYCNEFYVDSIFIGGGTPSLVDSCLIEDLMSRISAEFQITGACEITIESNPKTLTERKLEAYLKSGINRLSLGVQSMEPELLAIMGRAHGPQDVYKNYQLARRCGFSNINLDLMFAVPGMTLESWKHTLGEISSLGPEHLSMYSLQLEEDTPFFRAFLEGKLKEVPDALDREMYWEGLSYLKSFGYDQYEISNLAKPGFSCKHNLKYWSMEDYLGIGLGAHSFVKDTRFSNNVHLEHYLKNDYTFTTNALLSEENEVLIDRQSEFIFTGMRKIKGISMKEFEEKYKKSMMEPYGKIIEDFIEEKLLRIEGDFLKFTPLGIDLSNKVLSEFV